MKAIGRFVLVLWVAVSANIAVELPNWALADEGGASWGYGKTYQNNLDDDWQWYDNEHDFGGPFECYKGVWSDTESNVGDGAVVHEYALHQTVGFWPNEIGTYVYYVEWGASPSSDSDDWYAETNHYYCGDYYNSCAWPVNVVGYAYHYGNGAGYIYTESTWGCEYVEIGYYC